MGKDDGMHAVEAASPIGSNDDLTAAIVDLVGDDGLVDIERPVAEFDRILHLIPRAAGAVAVDVMIGHEDALPGDHGLVVVHARKPSLGWWTLDDDTHHDGHRAAWKIVEQIVNRGGAVDMRHDCLLDTDGSVVYGSPAPGRKRRRYFNFPSYRQESTT